MNRDPMPSISDAFEPVRLRLLAAGLLRQDGEGTAIVLTALDRGAGVTTVAVGLAGAVAAASSARVLLVDAAPLGTQATTLLGVTAVRRVCEDLGAEGAGGTVPVPGRGFDLIALARAPAPATRDDDTGWTQAWAGLRRAYDVVIVDPGPLDTDAPYLWEKWTDATVLVVDAERVTRERLASIRRQIDRGGVRVSGFVLNRRRFYVPDRLYRALS